MEEYTPAERKTSSSTKNWPVTLEVRILYAASAIISTLRHPWAMSVQNIALHHTLAVSSTPPPIIFIAAVQIAVRGQSALTETLPLNSSIWQINGVQKAAYIPAIPSTHMDIPNFAIVYATWSWNHLGLRESGGEIFKICGFEDFNKCGKHSREVT